MGTLKDRLWYNVWPKGVPRHIDYPKVPLFALLSNAARKYPGNIAFSCGGDRLGYKELDTATDKLAVGLNELEIKRGDTVVILLPNTLGFVIGYYGILKAGGIVSPANPQYKGEDLKHQLNDSGATAIITDANSYPIVKGIKDETKLEAVILTDLEGVREVVSLREILTRDRSAPLKFDVKPKEDVAAIEYTGGTTGLPKGAMLTHYNLVANAIQNATWLGWNSKDIIIGVLPFYHSWGACTCVNSPIYIGARVITLPRFDAEELFITIEKERATVLYGTASMFTMLASSPLISKYDLSSLKYVKAGAMPIPPEIKEKWEQLTGVKMVLGYGLSEASPETHDSPPQRVKPGTIGIPIMDTDARIVDEETGEIELPPGEVGELIIKGP